jgi:hypothetical protein
MMSCLSVVDIPAAGVANEVFGNDSSIVVARPGE